MTKISEVIESLLEIQKIHGDVAVYAPAFSEAEDEECECAPEWHQVRIRQGRYGEAIVVKMEGLNG